MADDKLRFVAAAAFRGPGKDMAWYARVSGFARHIADFFESRHERMPHTFVCLGMR